MIVRYFDFQQDIVCHSLNVSILLKMAPLRA